MSALATAGEGASVASGVIATVVFAYRLLRAADRAVDQLGELNRQQQLNHDALRALTARMVIQEERRNGEGRD